LEGLCIDGTIGARYRRLGRRDCPGGAVYSRRLYEAREVVLPWRGCVYPGGWAEDVGG
jgi:hypothetical protein